jgi:1,2-phenylacetyl-CoA epoxidase PaaB subunit
VSPHEAPSVADRTVRAVAAAPRSDVWEVFARKAYEEPLHHVGTVTEDDEDLALVSARSIYDEHPWVHMIIVPRDAIREAIRS